MEFSENRAFVPLESLMKKTFDRIMEDPTFKSIIDRLAEKNNGQNLDLVFSYKDGYDVASGQRRFLVSNLSYF